MKAARAELHTALSEVRSETARLSEYHASSAETCLGNAVGVEGTDSYRMRMLSEATAHATLAIYFQGEIARLAAKQ